PEAVRFHTSRVFSSLKMRMTMASPGEEPMALRAFTVPEESGWLCRLLSLLGRKPPHAASPKATHNRISTERILRTNTTTNPMERTAAPAGAGFAQHVQSW